MQSGPVPATGPSASFGGMKNSADSRIQAHWAGPWVHPSHHPISPLTAGAWLPLQAPLGASMSDRLARPRAPRSSVLTPRSPSPPSLTSPEVWPSLGCWVMRGTQNPATQDLSPFLCHWNLAIPFFPSKLTSHPRLSPAPPYISINVFILKCKIAQRWTLPHPGQGHSELRTQRPVLFPVWGEVSGTTINSTQELATSQQIFVLYKGKYVP